MNRPVRERTSSPTGREGVDGDDGAPAVELRFGGPFALQFPRARGEHRKVDRRCHDQGHAVVSAARVVDMDTREALPGSSTSGRAFPIGS